MKNSRMKKNYVKRSILLALVSASLVFFTSCLKSADGLEDIDSKSGNITGKGEENTVIDIKDNQENDDKKIDENSDNTSSDEKILETFLDENDMVTNQDSIEVVVNKERNLSEDYVPEDLVTISDVPTCLANPEVNQLRKPASDALTTMFDAAKDEIKIQLYARSGYRSYNTQVSLYNGYVSNHGQAAADKFSAKPGQSEHQTGLAMDITSDSVNLQLTEDFGDTEEGKWVRENAHRFGFIVRYPKGKEDITGYMYEPWHVRFVGEDLAAKVYESGLTLEQYLFENEE